MIILKWVVRLRRGYPVTDVVSMGDIRCSPLVVTSARKLQEAENIGI
jgi:hypothetical protein